MTQITIYRKTWNFGAIEIRNCLPFSFIKRGEKKRSSSELFKRHIKIVQHVVWHIYRYYITIIFVQVNFTNESFLKESAQIHNILFRFLWLLINAFTNTCSILNITFSCHSSLRKSNRLLTVFLWAYFEHTMAFFRYIFTFFFEFSADPWITIFFYVHYPFIHTWADRLHASRIYFQFLYFFILFLFVCLPGGSYEGKVNEFKQSKQTKKRTKRTRYVFFSALLPEPPAQSKGNRKRSYALFNK